MSARPPGIDRLLDQCLGLQAGEDLLLVVDEGTDASVVAALREAADDRRADTAVATVPRPTMPGEEPPPDVASRLREADAAIELTSLFIGSSVARQEATKAGTRYLAMPGVLLSTFRAGGPVDVDLVSLRAEVERIGERWTAATSFRLTTPAGTDLTGSVAGRAGRVLHGIATEAGAYMAPPDVESGTAPVEGTGSGVVVIDGDLLFMGPGPLASPVVLTFADGLLVSAEGNEVGRLTEMIERCDDPRMANLAEVSLGLNPAGSIGPVAMETESARGTAHIALGNSIAYGGTVDARGAPRLRHARRHARARRPDRDGPRHLPGRLTVQIDGHTHILSLASDADFTAEYGREGSLCIYRSMGLLPSHRCPTHDEWEATGSADDGFLVVGPEETVEAHPGFDKIVALAVSPQYLDGELIGTVDVFDITGVGGDPHPERCNEYLAGCVRMRPDELIGFASVNPTYRGVRKAVEELERAVTEYGLQGLKLYPMYQHWSPADRDVAFPIFEAAQALGIPVMIHQAGSTRIDARMEFARPALLDDVGRTFRDLRVIIAHCGIPWIDEAMFMLQKHPNFYADLSYHIATITRRDLFLFLYRAEPYFVPLEKLFFATDYPGFLYDPVALRDKLLTVNDEAPALGLPPIPQSKLDGIMGDNMARVLGLLGDDDPIGVT